jgi:hypothetical protein
MNRAMLKDHLAAAERHVAEAERQVAHQREVLARLERDGHDTAPATPLLEQFEEVLAIRVAYRDRLRDELGL